MENKIFRKSISVNRVFYGFDPKIGLHFYFHYKPFSGLRRAKRERERERKLSIHPKLIAPQHRRHHISRTTTKIASPPKIDPPKLIHRRLHHPRPIAPHRRPIHLDRSHPNRSTEDRITPDRLHPIEIASPPKTNPPKTDLIGAIVTHD